MLPWVPVNCTAAAWWVCPPAPGVGAGGLTAAPPGWTIRRRCDPASHCVRHWLAPNPTSAATSSAAVTHVITFSEVGARSRLRALATARLLCLISWRGTTGKVPVGGPVDTPYP